MFYDPRGLYTDFKYPTLKMDKEEGVWEINIDLFSVHLRKTSTHLSRTSIPSASVV